MAIITLSRYEAILNRIKTAEDYPR